MGDSQRTGGQVPDHHDRESAQQETIDGLNAAVTQPVAVTVQILQRIGHFVLLSELGRGGMGTVFAAYDETLDRKVAIKLLHQRAESTLVSRQRLRREAQAMARISHPNVVAVYEVGEVSDQVFVAMEFIDGITLSQWQKQPGRSWQELLGMYLQAGQGLAAAHVTGLVHRDFKADNVLVSRDGRARVLDFGLARLGGRAAETADKTETSPSRGNAADKLTVDGVISGTPGYMSPEQYGSVPVDARADQFSFCAALFEALFGRHPFAGHSAAEIAGNTFGRPIAMPPKHSPVPEEIQHALLRGLATLPEQRFPHMEDLLDALFLETTDSAAAAAASRKRLVSWTLVVGSILTVAAQLVRARSALQYRHMLPVSGVLIAAILGVGLSQYRTLLRNSYHRRMWLLIFVATMQNLGQRLIGWRLGLSYNQEVIPFELISMAGVAAIGGAYISRTMFGISGILVLATAAITLFGSSVARYVSPSYSIALFWMLWEWARGRGTRSLRNSSSPTPATGVPLSPTSPSSE